MIVRGKEVVMLMLICYIFRNEGKYISKCVCVMSWGEKDIMPERTEKSQCQWPTNVYERGRTALSPEEKEEKLHMHISCLLLPEKGWLSVWVV